MNGLNYYPKIKQNTNTILIDDVVCEESNSASWTPQRDAMLVEIYLRYYRDQSTVNGLKKSSWKYVTKLFNTMQPNAPAMDHIQIKNRFQKLKLTWMLYRDIQRRSGVGWDAEECVLSMPPQSWKDLHRDWSKRSVLSLVPSAVRRCPTAKDWKSKPFPLYHMLSAIHDGKAFTGENIASFATTFAEVERILESDVIDPNDIVDKGLAIPEQKVPPSVGVRKKSVPKPSSRKHGNLISLMQKHFAHQEKEGSKVEEAISYIAQ